MKQMPKEAISELLSLLKNKRIEIADLGYWLTRYKDLYRQTADSHSCIGNIPACYCCIRRTACLFSELYVKLNSIFKSHQNNLILGSEVEKYEWIRNSPDLVVEWLKVVEAIGLEEVLHHNLDNASDKIVNVNLGMQDNARQYIDIVVDRKYFEKSFQFNRIFVKLFFEDKLLEESYRKWKIENG